MLFTFVVAIGQPYLREVAQELTTTIIVRSKKAAKNLFFILRVIWFYNNKDHQIFRKKRAGGPVFFPVGFPCGLSQNPAT
jgi:hypothetical protein